MMRIRFRYEYCVGCRRKLSDLAEQEAARGREERNAPQNMRLNDLVARAESCGYVFVRQTVLSSRLSSLTGRLCPHPAACKFAPARA
jgi:hypothetical protein